MNMTDEPIIITNIERSGNGALVSMEVGREDIPEDQVTFNIQIDDDYYEEITEGAVDVETFAELAMQYMMRHADKTDFPHDFDLETIAVAYDDFDTVMREQIAKQ
jgi:hypothetical protein